MKRIRKKKGQKRRKKSRKGPRGEKQKHKKRDIMENKQGFPSEQAVSRGGLSSALAKACPDLEGRGCINRNEKKL